MTKGKKKLLITWQWEENVITVFSIDDDPIRNFFRFSSITDISYTKHKYMTQSWIMIWQKERLWFVALKTNSPYYLKTSKTLFHVFEKLYIPIKNVKILCSRSAFWNLSPYYPVLSFSLSSLAERTFCYHFSCLCGFS